LGIAVLTASSPALYGEEQVHIVQKGETLYSIARNLGIKAEDLMKINGISDPARLQLGQRLRVSVAVSAGSGGGAAVPAPSAVAPGNTSYKVVRGDTFFSIARKFSVSVEAIRRTNNLAENYVLREGDSLKLPAESKVPADARPPTESRTTPESGVPTAARTTPVPAAETKTAIPAVSWPVAVKELNYMTGKLNGVVITGAKTESVKSLTRGTVLSAGPYRGFGRVAIIQVDGGYLYVYGGCESLSVKEGDRVGPGTELGKLGIDAVTNKPQLFFMVYRSNTPVDPAKAPRA